MIALLTGTLHAKGRGQAIIDVHGVGYQVLVSGQTLEWLPETGKTVTLHVHTRVREDEIALIGFSTPEEKEMYLLLNTVSGVGPKLALSMLSDINADELGRAIREKNLARLTALSGVGKKTAQRLCMELQDKLGLGFAPSGGATRPTVAPPAGNDGFTDAASALVNLGYGEALAWQAMALVRQEIAEAGSLPVEELIREALRRLA